MTENSKYSSVNEGMFPSTAAQNYHTLHDLKKNTILFSLSSGGQRSKIKVLPGPCSLRGSNRDFFPTSNFWWLPAFLATGSFQFLPLPSTPLRFCVSEPSLPLSVCLCSVSAMKTLIGRAAEPIEIVNLILYVSSSHGAFMTGENILIDGGRNIMRDKVHGDYGIYGE